MGVRWSALTACVLSVSVQVASAQPYPNAPLTLVVPFAAGSGTDAVARIVAKHLGERLQQPVMVDNKAGASAQIGAQFVAKAKPDGYTHIPASSKHAICSREAPTWRWLANPSR